MALLRRAVLLQVLLVAGLTASTAAAEPGVDPGPLVVAMQLPDAGFQVGAVRHGEITFAAGFEADLARVLARRLGPRPLRLVQSAVPSRVAAPSARPWSVAIARLVPGTVPGVSFSTPYLRADQAVLARHGLPRPSQLADLAHVQLCALRKSRGADVIRARIRPAIPPLAARDDQELVRWVRTGRCDAALREAPLLGVALEAEPRGVGRLVGTVSTGVVYAVALPRGSSLAASVDRTLAAMRRDGTLRRLSLRWLGFDASRLRRLG